MTGVLAPWILEVLRDSVQEAGDGTFGDVHLLGYLADTQALALELVNLPEAGISPRRPS